MKRIILNIVVLTQIVLLSACTFGPPVKYYENKERLATNLPDVYVKDFQCWSRYPASTYSDYKTVIFTLENRSKCSVYRVVKLVLYDEADVRMQTCTWSPDDLEAFAAIPVNSAYYGTTGWASSDCNCDEYKRIEFKVKKSNQYCN